MGTQKLLLVERSLFCCRLETPFRAAMIKIAYSNAFDGLMIVVIIVNTLVIAFEDPSDPNLLLGKPDMYNPLNRFVNWADYGFTCWCVGLLRVCLAFVG